MSEVPFPHPAQWPPSGSKFLDIDNLYIYIYICVCVTGGRAPPQDPLDKSRFSRKAQVISDNYLILGSLMFRIGHVLCMKSYVAMFPRTAVCFCDLGYSVTNNCPRILWRLLFPFFIRDTLRAHRGYRLKFSLRAHWFFLITEPPPLSQ